MTTNTYVMHHPFEDVLKLLANLHRASGSAFCVDIQHRDENSASLKITQGRNPWFQLTSFVDLSREDHGTTRAQFTMPRMTSTWILLRGLGLIVIPILAALLLNFFAVALLAVLPLVWTVALMVFFRQSHKQVQRVLMASVNVVTRSSPS